MRKRQSSKKSTRNANSETKKGGKPPDFIYSESFFKIEFQKLNFEIDFKKDCREKLLQNKEFVNAETTYREIRQTEERIKALGFAKKSSKEKIILEIEKLEKEAEKFEKLIEIGSEKLEYAENFQDMFRGTWLIFHSQLLILSYIKGLESALSINVKKKL